ncbi:hypothetical protein Y032_0001g86 [Ancylostoma ceylanicum]|uniref:Uncharacterized protein n=1 Tax=Ancylostoma ceylanicum TaxID=53326 RepID=A0A016W4U4_9BILA|nr:hypothetical protein Y032_0001g86 [Ancylostoma ceylanicum]
MLKLEDELLEGTEMSGGARFKQATRLIKLHEQPAERQPRQAAATRLYPFTPFFMARSGMGRIHPLPVMSRIARGEEKGG